MALSFRRRCLLLLCLTAIQGGHASVQVRVTLVTTLCPRRSVVRSKLLNKVCYQILKSEVTTFGKYLFEDHLNILILLIYNK